MGLIKKFLMQCRKPSGRFEEHNTGRGGKYTRQNGPWKLVHSEHHSDRSSAAKREQYLKSTEGSQEKKKLTGVL
jgi:predicted GIY-YIG superfamily endonuclease